MTWLSPEDVQNTYRVGRTTAFDLMKGYKESGGKYIKIGKLTRFPQDSFETYLLEETEKYQNAQGS
jgi:hypothetical protein